MSIFSLNAFHLGVISFLLMGLPLFLYGLFCIIWRIKVIRIAIFFNPWFSLYSEDINGIEFVLGWLPLGSYVKPLGMLKTDIEEGKIPNESLPYTFLHKTKKQQNLFRLSPWISFIIVLFISLIFLDTSKSIERNIFEMGNYTLKSMQSMFIDNLSRQEFISFTETTLTGKSIIFFSTILFLTLILLLSAFKLATEWFSNSNERKGITKIIFGFLAFIVVLYFCVWKIPSFIFSFFSFTQIIKYLLSFFIGIFATGTVIFFTVVFIMKYYVVKIKSI